MLRFSECKRRPIVGRSSLLVVRAQIDCVTSVSMFDALEKYSTVYDGPHATLYDCGAEVPHLAIGRWKGFFRLSDSKFIDDMWESIRVMKELGTIAIISDHSELKVVSQDVLDWLHDNWYPNAQKNGLRVEASLAAESPTADLSLSRMLDESLTGEVKTPRFVDFDSAYAFCVEFLGKLE